MAPLKRFPSFLVRSLSSYVIGPESGDFRSTRRLNSSLSIEPIPQSSFSEWKFGDLTPQFKSVAAQYSNLNEELVKPYFKYVLYLSVIINYSI